MSEIEISDEIGKKEYKSDSKPPALVFVVGGLSFIPLCGVLFGLISIVWGLVTFRHRRGKILTLVGCLGIGFTIALYGGLFYFGFVQRGGVYDDLRAQLALNNLNSLVQSVEFYKLQEGEYPADLDELLRAGHLSNPAIMIDPTVTKFGSDFGGFHYEFSVDLDGYYLLGVGLDQAPFTGDDLLPMVKAENIGLLIHPDSQK